MRKKVDGTDMTEVYLEEEEEDYLDSVAPEPEAEEEKAEEEEEKPKPKPRTRKKKAPKDDEGS
jgi:hypothetical protein